MVEQRGSNVQRNRILNSMSNADLALMRPHLEMVPLKSRQCLQMSDKQIRHAYFPISGIASVIAIAGKEPWAAEVALVGCEGMTGLPVVYGTNRSPYEVSVQVEGDGHCIPADRLRDLMDRSITLLRCFLRYAHVFCIQSGYAVLANAQGRIEEKLARWLLMAHDRLGNDEMNLTHEFLALMLGVRRAGVTEALQVLEAKGLIATARGCVAVIDRSGLEACANGLYGPPEAEFERLFG